MIIELKPGRMIEFDGELYYVEAVRLEVLAQKVGPLKPLIERNDERWKAGDYDTPPETHCPCFIRLQGDLSDEVFQSPKLKILFPEGEAE